MNEHERRLAPRVQTLISGYLQTSQLSCYCQILDFSESGAKIRPVEDISKIEHAEFTVGDQSGIHAEVIWRHEDQAGLRFSQRRLQVDKLITVERVNKLAPARNISAAYHFPHCR